MPHACTAYKYMAKKNLIILENYVVIKRETRIILCAQASYEQKYNKKNKFRNMELRTSGTS